MNLDRYDSSVRNSLLQAFKCGYKNGHIFRCSNDSGWFNFALDHAAEAGRLAAIAKDKQERQGRDPWGSAFDQEYYHNSARTMLRNAHYIAGRRLQPEVLALIRARDDAESKRHFDKLSGKC